MVWLLGLDNACVGNDRHRSKRNIEVTLVAGTGLPCRRPSLWIRIRTRAGTGVGSRCSSNRVLSRCCRVRLQRVRRGGTRMETAIRFHTLMVTIAHVSSTVSCSLKWTRTSS